MYRVDVVACSVADAVRRAGGWIFDHTMQGWTVNVRVPQPCDSRPLEILGAIVNESRHSDCVAPQVILQSTGTTRRVEHRLSGAARVFKAQALLAAGLAPRAGGRETLFIAGQFATTAGLLLDRKDDEFVKVIEFQSITPTGSS